MSDYNSPVRRILSVNSPEELRSLPSPEASPNSCTVRLREHESTNQCRQSSPARKQSPCRYCSGPSEPVYTFFPDSAGQVLPSPLGVITPSEGGDVHHAYSPNLSSPNLDIQRARYEVPPGEPLMRPIRRLLEFTEFPFMILWTFASYWTVILCYAARDTTTQMWLSACFAGILVGTALNANAYKYIVKPKTRSRTQPTSCPSPVFRSPSVVPSPFSGAWEEPPRIPSAAASGRTSRRDVVSPDERNHILKMVNRFPRFFSQLVDTKRPCVRRSPISASRLESQVSPGAPVHSHQRLQQQRLEKGGAIHALSSGMNSLTKLARDWSNIADTLEWELDIPTILRFFFIPFAVSSIAGMTSDEEKYILVFPTDEWHLTMAIVVPFCWVSFLLICRMLMLHHLKVVWRWKVVFFNGCLIH